MSLVKDQFPDLGTCVSKNRGVNWEKACKTKWADELVANSVLCSSKVALDDNACELLCILRADSTQETH